MYVMGIYYIDRCDLWGFIREINSDISHVRYQFFSAGTTFTQQTQLQVSPTRLILMHTSVIRGLILIFKIYNWLYLFTDIDISKNAFIF